MSSAGTWTASAAGVRSICLAEIQIHARPSNTEAATKRRTECRTTWTRRIRSQQHLAPRNRDHLALAKRLPRISGQWHGRNHRGRLVGTLNRNTARHDRALPWSRAPVTDHELALAIPSG